MSAFVLCAEKTPWENESEVRKARNFHEEIFLQISLLLRQPLISPVNPTALFVLFLCRMI